MEPTHQTELDSRVLQAAVEKGLISQAKADETRNRAASEKTQATMLLIKDGVLTQHIVDNLAAPSGQVSEPQAIAGFKIQGRLGQGGMGTVYRALQVSMNRSVALKVIARQFAQDAAFCDRFLREARAAGAVNHPNVITCYDVGQADGWLYMALELMSGGDASTAAKLAGGKLPEAQALRIIADGARGLTALKRAGLMHRDIKPANIFISEDGIAKLGDLGLARSTSGDDRMTMTGAAMGTPAFMSPEQASGDAHLDIRTDIYALGATLFALLTGDTPFRGQSAFAVVAKVINDPVPDPRSFNPGISDHAAAVVLMAMAKDRDRRYATPEAMIEDIERALTGREPLHAKPVPRPTLAATVLQPPSEARPTPATAKGASAGQNSSSMATIVNAPSTSTAAEPARGSRVPLVLGAAALLAAGAVVAVVAGGHRPAPPPAPEHPVAAAPAQPPPAAQPAQPAPTPAPVAPPPVVPTAHEEEPLQPLALAPAATPPPRQKLTLDTPPELTASVPAPAPAQPAPTPVPAQPAPTPAPAPTPTPEPAAPQAVAPAPVPAPTAPAAAPRPAPVAAPVKAALRPLAPAPAKAASIPAAKLDAYRAQLKERKLVAQLADAGDGGLVVVADPGTRDLSGLAGLPVTRLECEGCDNLATLAPLAGLPLRSLVLIRCSALKSLAGIEQLKLESLDLSNCTDLEGGLDDLRQMPLTELHLAGCRSLASLSGLEGARLGTLDLTDCRKLTSVAGIAGMPLKKLVLQRCGRIADLSALAGMPIADLDLTGCASLTSLDGLRGLPLTRLAIEDCKRLASLKGIDSPQLGELTITRCAALKDLDGLQNLKLRKLTVVRCEGLTSLAGLAGTQLSALEITECGALLGDLAALGGLPLRTVSLRGCSGLTSLAGLEHAPLKQVTIASCKRLTDLAAADRPGVEVVKDKE